MNVEEAREKYVIAVSFDISGVFDTAWWPGFLRVLRTWRYPRNLYEWVKKYFQGKDAVLNVGNVEAVKRLTNEEVVHKDLLWSTLVACAI